MRRIPHRLTRPACLLLLGGLVAVSPSIPAQAELANAPSLTISQLKITSSNGQFVTLYNATDTTLDMSKYELEYFNHFDVSKATSSRLVALSGSVPPHGYYMVNDSELSLCFQLAINSVSLGFSSTAGMVELLSFEQGSAGGAVVPRLQDYVGWSKTAASGAQTLPSNTNAFLLRQPLDSRFNPIITSAGGGSWQTVQPDSTNACRLISYNGVSATPVTTGMGLLLPASEPPATILNGTDGSDGSAVAPPHMPAADIGLQSPRLSEVLPNPIGNGTDKTDEFIELYNGNDKPFDLSGFSLQVGTTSAHTYTFPAGTQLPPRQFIAYFSKATGLSMSNTTGQARLLDPFNNNLQVSDVYTNAKDGQAWALAKGKWYWTTKVTPGAANVINQPIVTKKKSAASKTTKKPNTAKLTTTAGGKSSGALASGSADEDTKGPVHITTLVIVGGLALLYGAYEYRTDLANRLRQCRRHARPGKNDSQ